MDAPLRRVPPRRHRRYSELDRLFHQTISVYTHNPLMAQLTDLISTRIAPSRRSTLQSVARLRTSNDGHRRIYEAIAQKDSALAEEAARQHVRTVFEQILLASAERPAVSTDEA
ncbi:FadR/GntR family transcriptional regulator [Rathayibacter tritici]|uniref:FadR/GntR family transcriptional regulator n=1 Tax=Rathayibacter tritici TaxID=33888 RepID=UPI001F2DEF53|nr:FCD domain-containing protein [Rathayibacter tritici]